MKSIHYILLILLITLFFYLPALIYPNLLIERGNDLQEQFWPVFYFIKQQVLINHTLPLWNNLFFSGLPLLPDPQFSLFYPPNVLFIILPTSIAFIVYFIFHTFLGGMGVYLTARYAFRFSLLASLFTAVIYIFTPRLAGYLEAGHYGLAASLAYLPFIVFAVCKLLQTSKFFWTALLSVSLAGIFFLHTITFILTLISTCIFFASIMFLTIPKKHWLKLGIYFGAGLLLVIGFSAISLLPQLEWSSSTTRFLLISSRDIYPKWFSVKEFIQNIAFPWIQGGAALQNIDIEKWLFLGTIPLFLAGVGFLKLKRNFQIILTISAIFIVLISLNNTLPFYSFLISQDWYALMRVSTRVWFIPLLTVTFLAGWGLENLLKNRSSQYFIIGLAVLAIIELLFFSWIRLSKPIPSPEQVLPSEIYEFLKQDSDKYRIFCLTRCIPQQKAALLNLELIEGYNTLQQMNYYKHFWQLSGGYWNWYTLALPPMGVEKLQPDAESLGLYNTKYIISPYQLTDKNFILEKRLENYFIYKNNLFKPRAYFLTDERKVDDIAPILKYTPNHIRVDTSKNQTKRLVLSEVYSPGWTAYLNGVKKTSVQETPNALRLVDLKPGTQFVDFKYEPESYRIGKIITLTTILTLVVLWIKRKTLKI